MTYNELKIYVNQGNEIELQYKNKKYSITYGEIDGRDVISFCEFYKDTIEFDTVDELWNGIYHDMKISDILLSLTEEDVWIY